MLRRRRLLLPLLIIGGAAVFVGAATIRGPQEVVTSASHLPATASALGIPIALSTGLDDDSQMEIIRLNHKTRNAAGVAFAGGATEITWLGGKQQGGTGSPYCEDSPESTTAEDRVVVGHLNHVRKLTVKQEFHLVNRADVDFTDVKPADLPLTKQVGEGSIILQSAQLLTQRELGRLYAKKFGGAEPAESESDAKTVLLLEVENRLTEYSIDQFGRVPWHVNVTSGQNRADLSPYSFEDLPKTLDLRAVYYPWATAHRLVNYRAYYVFRWNPPAPKTFSFHVGLILPPKPEDEAWITFKDVPWPPKP